MFTFKLIKSSVNSVRITQRNIVVSSGRHISFFNKNEEKPAEETALDIIDAEEEDPILRQQRIDRMCNKSGLRPPHRSVMRGELPYKMSESWIHNTLKYKRKLYGKLGSDSNVDPSKIIGSIVRLM